MTVLIRVTIKVHIFQENNVSHVLPDEIRAWSDQQCGGNVSLDQQPAYIKLSLPKLFNDAWTLNPITQQSGTLQNCTWGLDIPPGKTVLLKLEWSEDGTRISVRCVGSKDQVLQSGDSAVLSGCDRNKATLSWTGGGRSSDSLQLLYFGEKTFLD